MTTESEKTEEQQAAAEVAEMEAGFSAAFNDEAIKPAPTPAPAATEEAEKGAAPAVPEKTETEEVQGTEAAQTPVPSPAPTPAPFDTQAEFRKLHGRIGDLNSQLQQALKAKEEAGKPATATPLELKRLKEQYPDLAGFLQEDLAESLTSLAPKAADPNEIKGLIDQGVAQGVARQMAKLRDAQVTAAHEHWKTDLYADLKTGTKTAEYQAWLKTMPDAEAKAFEDSTNPYLVINKLNQFYDWKGKEAKAKTEKDERLKAAITPKGVPRAGQQTMSDDEALAKGFSEGFNS